MVDEERKGSEDEREPEQAPEGEAMELDPEKEPVIDDEAPVEEPDADDEPEEAADEPEAVEAGAVASTPGRRRRPSRRTIAREDRRRRTEARRKRKRALYVTGGSIVAAMLIFGLALPSFGNLGQNTGGDDTSQPQQLVGTEVPVDVASVIEQDEAHPPYSTVPATSGPRYSEPAGWGIHDDQQAEEHVVQNLALGGVVFNHNLSDPTQVDELRTYVEGLSGYPACYVLQPHDGVEEGTITMTSWGWTQQVDDVDRFAMNLFVADHRNKGLEFIDQNCGVEGAETPPTPTPLVHNP